MVGQELEPIDPNRCQSERKAGSFMTLGPRGLVRCRNKADWIGIQVKDGVFYGAMSLCDECKRVCEIQEPEVYYQKLLGEGGE